MAKKKAAKPAPDGAGAPAEGTAMARILSAQAAVYEFGRGPSQHNLVPGQNYYFRGPRSDYVGQLVAVTGPYTVALTRAAWVAHSGRLHAFVRDGTADNMEIEPVGMMPCVQFQDAVVWPHPLFDVST